MVCWYYFPRHHSEIKSFLYVRHSMILHRKLVVQCLRVFLGPKWVGTCCTQGAVSLISHIKSQAWSNRFRHIWTLWPASLKKSSVHLCGLRRLNVWSPVGWPSRRKCVTGVGFEVSKLSPTSGLLSELPVCGVMSSGLFLPRFLPH